MRVYIQINNLFKKAATIKLPIVFILYILLCCLTCLCIASACLCLSNKSYSVVHTMDGRTAIIGFFVCLLAFFFCRAHALNYLFVYYHNHKFSPRTRRVIIMYLYSKYYLYIHRNSKCVTCAR